MLKTRNKGKERINDSLRRVLKMRWDSGDSGMNGREEERERGEEKGVTEVMGFLNGVGGKIVLAVFFTSLRNRMRGKKKIGV